MSAVRLEFPVLVRNEVREGRRHYVVRPLFQPDEEGVARTFDDALEKCLRKVRALFASWKTDRANLERLLWYCFSPRLESRVFELEFKSGAKTVRGRFGAAWFDHGNLRYVCLPGFESHLFALPPAPRGRHRMDEEVDRAVQHLLRREKRELGEDAPDPGTHLAGDREFVTEAGTTVHVEGAPFPSGPGAGKEMLEALLGGAAEVSGSVEIEKVARDLGLLPPEERFRAWGVEEAVRRVSAILFEEDPVPTVLVGPRGVGKTSIVHEAVSRNLAAHPRGEMDRLPKVWELEPSRVIAGQRVVGMWQNRMEAILGFVRDRLRKRHNVRRPDTIYVDNPVALLRVGKTSQNDMTLAGLLKSWIERREIGLLLEATPEAWRLVQEIDRGFADLFRVVRLAEPPLGEALRIAVRERQRLEPEFGCRIGDGAIGRLLELHRAWPRRRALPGGIVSPLKELAGTHRKQDVGPAQADQAFETSTGLSRRIFDPGQRLDEEELRAFIDARLVGQPEAARILADTIHLAKARLGDPERPVASLLFIGPTGVGKTEAAKVLAGFLFGDAGALVRFDMNEYVDPSSAARLIGGAGRGEGQLTERIRHRPFSVLLFDEIEKADSSVHDLLLQVLGEGRLTDALGRTADFSASIVILTSNLGAGEARRTMGFGGSADSQAAHYRKAVVDFFRPEFVNRIDRIVAFGTLGLPDVKRIARLQVRRFLERDGLVRRQTFLQVSERALDRIAEAGFDPDMGGRALKRSLEKEVAVVAADRLNALPPEEPLFLELFRREGRLHPRVTALHCVPRRAGPPPFRPPEPAGLPEFYRGLLEIAKEVEVDLKTGPAGTDRSLLRSTVQGLRREIQETLYDLEDRAPRTVQTPDGGRPGLEIEEGHLRAAFARLDLRSYLEELYRRAPPRSAQGGPALGHFIRLAAADHAQRVLAAGGGGRTCLHLHSWGGPQDERILVMLTARFLNLIGDVDRPGLAAENIETEPEGDRFLIFRDPAMGSLLRSEEGLHLFFPPHQAGVPVGIRVLPVPEGVTPVEFVRSDRAARVARLDAFETGDGPEPDPPGRIVRLYCPPSAGSEGTATDLATGQILPFDFSYNAWFLWLYGARPESERIVFGE